MSETEPTSTEVDSGATPVDTRHVITARFMFATHAEAARAAESIDRVDLSGLLASELTIEEV